MENDEWQEMKWKDETKSGEGADVIPFKEAREFVLFYTNDLVSKQL